jgi:tetratricopeptide (TPR) repeat protein
MHWDRRARLDRACRSLSGAPSHAVRTDKTGHYEVALDRFTHYLALVETDPSTTIVNEMRATLTSNIGACLHHLNDVDGAIEYYERALQEFKAVPFTLYSRLSIVWLVYGNVIDKRIEYVEKKLASIRAGEAPDASTYQDGYGKSRKWTKEEMEGKSWSVWRPRTWFGYGMLQEVGITDAGVNSAVAAA